MSLLSETKQLLRTHRISPNKSLGQNFMIDADVFERLSAYAELERKDVVLDVGAGLGFLTRFLAGRVGQVIAVEADPKLASVLRTRLRGFANSTVLEGDLFRENVPCVSKVVSIPPYQISSRLVMWLFRHHVDHAVLIFQKEFAKRLVAEVGTEDYGWITVAVYYHAKCELLDRVPKSAFYPQPKVDSAIVCLSPKRSLSFAIVNDERFTRLIRLLFTQRNRKVRNAVQTYLKLVHKMNSEKAMEIANSIPLKMKRVRELTPEDFGVLSNELCGKTSIL